MRAAALLALGCYAAIASADVADDVEGAASSVSSAAEEATSSVESVVESVTSAAVEKPTFTPTTIKADFLEQFVDLSRWQASHAKKENTEEEWQYVGTWEVEEPTVLKGIEGDKGLVLKDKAAHHAISAKFDKPISNKKDTLVVQYEVKPQAGLECGGAYMKLLQDSKKLASDEFSNASPYIIMFGPDKCGSTNKVHFIFRHKNPKTGEYEEKHLKNPPAARTGKLSSLYTLIVKPDQTYEIKLDNESVKTGSILEDFDPPVNPEKEIDDPKDTKPEDWVDESRIPDPEATKPDDWDEDAPYEIVDEEAEKPADWLEDEPLMIPDPEAEKPEDWDDEEDGDWVAPQIPNPKGDEVSGLGPWEKPMIKNPAYKGKWKAEMIDNPAYKGVWAPRKIANPDYYEDKTPANLEPMGAIGFELWTMQNDILFDNIYIGHSESDADAFAKETWVVKHASEKAEEEKNKPKKDEKAENLAETKFMDDPVKYAQLKWDMFQDLWARDPMQAIKLVPEVTGAIGIGAVTLLAVLAGLLGVGAKAAPSKEELQAQAQKAKAKAADLKDQATDAATTGVDKAKEEVNKRTTRSAAQ